MCVDEAVRGQAAVPSARQARGEGLALGLFFGLAVFGEAEQAEAHGDHGGVHEEGDGVEGAAEVRGRVVFGVRGQGGGHVGEDGGGA